MLYRFPHFTDGYNGTPRETSRAPKITRPFKDAIPADLFARDLERRYLVDPRAFAPRLGSRTSYTNHLTYSEDFSNAAWTKTEVTQTAAQLANPWDGLSTFSKILEAATTAEHRLERAYTFTAAAHTLSALVAGGLTRGFVRLMSYDGTTFRSAFFDLTNSVVFGTPSGCTAALRRYVTPAGAVSYKVSITFTPLAAAGGVYLNASTNGSTVSYLGSTSAGFYCGGLQLGLVAGPYIVTTSAARTVSVPDVDGIYNASAVDADDFAFHTGETDLDSDATAPQPLARTYSRIPAPQSKPISKWIDRPVMTDIFTGSVYAVSVDGGKTTHIFASSDLIACTSSVVSSGSFAGYTNIIHAGHGRSVGDRYVAWSNGALCAFGTIANVFDANSFRIRPDDIVAGGNSAPTHYCLQSAADVRYVNGPIEADAEEYTTFHLLGFSANAATTISNSDQIPLTATQMAAAAWLAILEAHRAAPSNTTRAIESTQGKSPYRGQIIGYTVTKVQVADVYETTSV